MLQALSSWLGEGLQPTQLSTLQVCLRGLIIFFAALLVVRVADKRFLGKKTAFDFLLALILASFMARAINGSERLVPTIVAAFLLALLHQILGALAVRWPAFGGWIKGHSETIIENGEVHHETMQRHHIGSDDLDESLRLKGAAHPAEVRLARLERSGEISVVKKEPAS